MNHELAARSTPPSREVGELRERGRKWAVQKVSVVTHADDAHWMTSREQGTASKHVFL